MTYIIEQYKEQMEEIMRYGKSTGFDFDSMTPETLKELMRQWVINNAKFYRAMSESPAPVQKSILKLSI